MTHNENPPIKHLYPIRSFYHSSPDRKSLKCQNLYHWFKKYWNGVDPESFDCMCIRNVLFCYQMIKQLIYYCLYAIFMKKILEDISNFINNKNRYLTLERNIHLKIKSASNVKFCQVLSHHIF